VASERLGIADVYQARDELERILEARTGVNAALHAKSQEARSLAAEVLVNERLARVIRQAGVVDPGGFRMFLQEFGHFQRVFAMSIHTQAQRFQPLQDQEGVERRNARAHIAQRHSAGAADKGGSAERLGVNHAVIAHFRLVESLEAGLVLGPGELATIHDDAADAGAVAAHIFGQRMHHDVGAVLERSGQVGRRHRVVHNQRHAAGMRDFGEGGEVHHIAERVADGFAVNRFGALVDQRGGGLRVVGIDKLHIDAVLRQRVREQVVSAAVQRAGGDDVVARLGDGQDRIGDRRLSGCQRQRANAAFEGSDALLQHVGGRIHDARIDIALHLQIEEIRAVLGVVKGVTRRLIEWHGDRFGGRIGRIAGVNGKRIEAHEFPPVKTGMLPRDAQTTKTVLR